MTIGVCHHTIQGYTISSNPTHLGTGEQAVQGHTGVPEEWLVAGEVYYFQWIAAKGFLVCRPLFRHGIVFQWQHHAIKLEVPV